MLVQSLKVRIDEADIVGSQLTEQKLGVAAFHGPERLGFEQVEDGMKDPVLQALDGLCIEVPSTLRQLRSLSCHAVVPSHY